MPSIRNQNYYETKDILQPKNDVVFQALFTRGKESITKAMLEDILKIKIDKLELDKSKDLLNDNKDDKNGRLDLRAVINGDTECDIEMQLETHDKFIERVLYYWAKMYTANLKVGDSYDKLKKTISIIIVDSEIPSLKELEKAHTKWQIREDENRQIILTSYFECHIIELPKAIREYKKDPQNEVLQWMVFLDNPKDEEVAKIMEENKDIKEAKEELDKISRDDVLRRMALKKQLEEMDRKQFAYDAEQRGLKQGKELGEKSERIKIAQAMLKEKMELELIAKTTGLTIEEIKELQKQ